MRDKMLYQALMQGPKTMLHEAVSIKEGESIVKGTKHGNDYLEKAMRAAGTTKAGAKKALAQATKLQRTESQAAVAPAPAALAAVSNAIQLLSVVIFFLDTSSV